MDVSHHAALVPPQAFTNAPKTFLHFMLTVSMVAERTYGGKQLL